MSRVKLIVALLVVGGMCGAVSRSFANYDMDPGKKCQCYFPNSNDYGIYDAKGNCEKLDCWVPIIE